MVCVCDVCMCAGVCIVRRVYVVVHVLFVCVWGGVWVVCIICVVYVHACVRV